jgi:membrane-anchored glycerophosphoryl diester phosphodiesterase (GDPDase)
MSETNLSLSEIAYAIFLIFALPVLFAIGVSMVIVGKVIELFDSLKDKIRKWTENNKGSLKETIVSFRCYVYVFILVYTLMLIVITALIFVVPLANALHRSLVYPFDLQSLIDAGTAIVVMTVFLVFLDYVLGKLEERWIRK